MTQVRYRSIVSIINDDPTGGYRQGTFVSLHSTVRRDTVTSLPAGSVTRGIDVGGRSKKCRVTWFTCTGASVRGRGNTDRSKASYGLVSNEKMEQFSWKI